MKAQGSETIIKKMLLTTKGQLEPPTPTGYLILPHQPLHLPPITSISKPLTLQTLPFHKSNLLTLQNTSVTPTLFDHQIHSLLSSNNGNYSKAIIVDSSSFGENQKTAEVFNKYVVIRGYNFVLPGEVSKENLEKLSREAEVLSSKENIGKEVQYTFSVKSDEQRGFIGQIDLPYHYKLAESNAKLYRQSFSNLMTAYSEYSTKTGCPIFINLLPHGSQGHSSQSPTLSSLIKFLTTNLSSSCYHNTILINPVLPITRSVSGQTIQYNCQNLQQIKALYNNKFTICFDLSRYQNQKCLIWIGQFMQQWPQQTIISAGLKYKTDFIMFGGEGLAVEGSANIFKQILKDNYEGYISKSASNILKLLSWYQKKIVIVQVKMWKCIKCGKESPETEQSFRKFGKDFCTIDCLRAYKF